MRLLNENFTVFIDDCEKNFTDCNLSMGDGTITVIKIAHIDKEKNWIEISKKLMVPNNGDIFLSLTCAIYEKF